jgi:hypothetical protein
VLVREGELTVERDPARPTGRLLRQGEMDASYIDLADARHLEFDYMRWLRLILRTMRARRIVHVGGAACALARALAAEWPDGRQEVCELDAEVLELARRHLGLRRTPGLHVRRADGRTWLADQPDGSWDVVVIDAFLGARIPRRLISRQALADAGRVAPLVLVNVVDDRGRREVLTVAAGLAAAGAHVWTLGGRAGNTIVGGGDRPPPAARIAAAAAADRSPARLVEPAALARQLVGVAPIDDSALDR